jgi:DNA-binding NarL/FixJ family response regulator
MPAPIRLLIVDDEDLFREGLARLFSRDGDFRVAGQARSGQEALELARRAAPDVLLTALSLRDMSGLQVARSIAQGSPGVKVAIIARAFNRATVLEAARCGVMGYITKETTLPALVEALKRVARGEAHIPVEVSSLLLEELAGKGVERPDEEMAMDRAKITDREREVLQLLVDGATNRDIARRLNITENTVKVHLRNILDKLHLRNRQQAAAFAISAGLVALPRGREPGHRRTGSARHRGHGGMPAGMRGGLTPG